ncbi:EMB2731 [Symbiodinium sp. CCMP2592]|nr:EMB2731 [Symbiodinium sp. CCMP2592]
MAPVAGAGGGGSAHSLTGYSFSPKAYAKAVLHSCKHSAAPVLGLLLGTANGKVLKVADAIPLFHTHALALPGQVDASF